MSENGVKQPDGADKPLGEIVADVTQKAQLLVREEIALAKAEITLKTGRLVKGAVAFAAAGFFGLLMLIFALHMLSIGIAEWFDLKAWVGYAATVVLLLLFVIVSALVGLRFFKKGAPPTPDYAIEEAQKTKVVLEEARN
jgi:hypothetical protein